MPSRKAGYIVPLRRRQSINDEQSSENFTCKKRITARTQAADHLVVESAMTCAMRLFKVIGAAWVVATATRPIKRVES